VVDGDDLAGVADDLAPAQGDARLDGDPGGAGRQHLLPVGGVLLGEPLQAGGGDHPGGGALLLEDLPGGHGHADLGAGGDQDDLGGRLVPIGVGGLGQDVGAARQVRLEKSHQHDSSLLGVCPRSCGLIPG